jgi:hypothetical protein
VRLSSGLVGDAALTLTLTGRRQRSGRRMLRASGCIRGVCAIGRGRTCNESRNAMPSSAKMLTATRKTRLHHAQSTLGRR